MRYPRVVLWPLLAAVLLFSGTARAQVTDPSAPPADATPEEVPPPVPTSATDAEAPADDADAATPAAETPAERPHAGDHAPTLRGSTGLIRVVTTDIGAQHTFRIGLHSEVFKHSDFLVNGDTNSRFIGTLSLSYTPWKYLEAFAFIRSSTNKNERAPESDRLDQELILALGDFGFGAKGQYPIKPWLGVGANFDLSFLNSVGGVSPDGDSTSFYIGLISSLDLAPLADFPIRFHFNFGYFLDNSDNLTEGVFDSYSLSSVQVEKFALGLNRKRLQFRLGADLPLKRWTKIGVTPMLEFAADVATGEADPDFNNDRFVSETPVAGKITPEDIDGRSTLWMTLGVRVNPIQGFNVELASDIGLTSPGYGHGPPVVPWNLIIGLSYSYDPVPPVKVIKSEPVVKTVVKTVAPPAGKVRGRVVNANTLEPVEGAVVTFPGKDLTGLYTDPDGSFRSYELAPGQHTMMVRKDGFQSAKVNATVEQNQETKLEVKLVPELPKVGTIRGRVDDGKGNAVNATVKLEGPEKKEVTVGAGGDFTIEVKPGRYDVLVEAKNYLRKAGEATVTGGSVALLNFSLSPKPRKRLVRVTKNAITKFAKIKFETGSAAIKAESRQLLDAIVDGLLGAPQIRKVEIQGHTDNRGSYEANMKLSEARANAVRSYLVQGGVSADRLLAKGYGPTRPKRPNITARNRAMNRRVEFLVLETK